MVNGSMSCASLLSYNGPEAESLESLIRDLLKKRLDQEVSDSKSVATLRSAILAAGYEPQDQEGTINDFSLPWRLRLIVNNNYFLALGAGRWRSGFDDGAYDAFPAAELIADCGEIDEEFWTERWMAAGGKSYAGRRIAMLSDPVWLRISVYGVPWEPFDCIGATTQQSVSREEVEELGVKWTESMEVQPVMSDSIFFFRDLPDWQGEWKALKALALDL